MQLAKYVAQERRREYRGRLPGSKRQQHAPCIVADLQGGAVSGVQRVHEHGPVSEVFARCYAYDVPVRQVLSGFW